MQNKLGATLTQRLLSQLAHNGTSEPACSVRTYMEHTRDLQTFIKLPVHIQQSKAYPDAHLDD